MSSSYDDIAKAHKELQQEPQPSPPSISEHERNHRRRFWRDWLAARREAGPVAVSKGEGLTK